MKPGVAVAIPSRCSCTGSFGVEDETDAGLADLGEGRVVLLRLPVRVRVVVGREVRVGVVLLARR